MAEGIRKSERGWLRQAEGRLHFDGFSLLEDATIRNARLTYRLLTLGSDPARFQTKPPACYRASWQLLGRDFHALATTSLCWISYFISTSNAGRTHDPG